MVEDITTALSRLNSLFVIAHNCAFTSKGRAVDVKQVGRARRALRAGRQRARGSQPRARQRTARGRHERRASLGRSFRWNAQRLFELQDQVAEWVVGSIEPR